MAGRGIQIVVGAEYNGRDLKRAQADLNRLGAQAKKTSSPVQQLSNGFQKKLTPNFAAMGAAAAAAGAAIVAFAARLAVEGIQAAAAEEQSLAKLQTALNNVGQGFRLSEVEKFIDDMQRASGVADDELRPALQTLVTATGNATQAQDLLALALDVSVATSKDLTSVAGALGKAANGQFTQINRLTNGALNPSILATKDLGVVTSELSRLYGGQAAANAETFAGQMARLKIAFDELLEAFGQGFIDGFTDGAEVTKELGDSLKAAEPGMKEFGQGLGDLVRTLTPVMVLFDDVVSLFKYSIPAALASAAVAFPPLAAPIAVLTGSFFGAKGAVDAAAESVDTIGVKFTGPMSAAAQNAQGSLQGIEEATEDAEDAFEQLNDQLNTFFGFLDKRDAARGFQDSIDELRRSLKENGKSFDTNTEAGRKNEEALDGVFDSALKVAEGQATAAEKVKTMEDAARTAAAQLDKTNMSDAAKARLLQPFDDAIAKFREATTQVDNLKREMELIPRNININVNVNRVIGTAKQALYEADGGPIAGLGFGTRRGSDTVPAMLTPGEFVISRPMVQRFGRSFFSQLNAGINPLAGMTPSAASSGGGLTINGGINVTSASGERAEESLPRALRRMSFLAGI